MSKRKYTNADFARAMAQIERTSSVALVSLTGAYHNLLRMWAET